MQKCLMSNDQLLLHSLRYFHSSHRKHTQLGSKVILLFAKCCLRHLSATIPGAVILGISVGMERDLLTLVANLKPGMGDWIAFVLSNQDPQ